RKQQEEERDRQKKQKEDEANRVINEPMFQDQKRKSQENLKKIAKALLDYEKKYGQLPYARYGGPDNEAAFGKGLSWRVAILPFLGRQDLYDRFQFDKPWHNPANRTAAEEMPEVFMSPRHPGEKKRTYYQVFTGDGLFGKQNVPPQTKVPSRPANAVFLVPEGSALIDWHAPRD